MGSGHDVKPPKPSTLTPTPQDDEEHAGPSSMDAESERRSAPSSRELAPKSAPASAPVLVIDDSEIARDTMCRVLRNAGWAVVALPSPIGATQAIVRYQARIVVIDVFMPTLRGDRLVSLFRKNPRLGHLSVILVSGHPEHELERLRQEVGADAVLSKRDLERLPALVKRLATKAR